MNVGLNLIRAISVLFVFFSHFGITFLRQKESIFFSYLAYIGVEIFFVLSGFLIGRILTKISKLDFKNFVNFVIRRWLRTLPLYYLILFINLILFLPDVDIFIKFLFFTQNDYLIKFKDEPFLPVSWSLCVEELYYIVIPILFFILNLIVKNKKTIVMSLLIISIILHFYISSKYMLDFAQQRASVFLRFGALLTGFGLVFFIKNLKLNNFWIIIWSLLGLFFTFFFFLISFVSVGILSAICFLVVNLLIALILFLIYNINLKIGYSDRLAKISYPFYLVHFTVIYLLSNIFDNNIGNSIFALILSFFLSCLFSFYLNKYIEAPIMRYRELKFKND